MTDRTDRSAAALAELIVLLGRMVENRGRSGGLKPSQWHALRYFQQAQAEARTVGAFARYMMVGHTTASQTASSLVRRKLLQVVDGPDGRATYLEPTPAGANLLETSDPLLEVASALRDLDEPVRDRISDALIDLVRLILPQSPK